MVKETPMNTKGAAEQLGCTENWIHKLVYAGRLKAYIYNKHGILVEREAKDAQQGQGLYFYPSDIKKYQNSRRRTPGRPEKASKDKTASYNKEYYQTYVKPKREREKQEKQAQ